MALVLGTNCGFVTSAPTEDPNGGGTAAADNNSIAQKFTTTDAITITEIGWWCDNATEAANFEVGIYSHNGGTDRPKTLLYSSKTNAKGTGAGWKVDDGLSFDLDASTTYWIAIQCDNTQTQTNIDLSATIPSQRFALDSSTSTLPATFTSDASYIYTYAIYAVYETGGAPTGTNQWINVDDTWRQLSEAWVNVDDAWRKVTEAWVNVDDTWRKLYSV